MPTARQDVRIERRDSSHPAWQELMAFADERDEGIGLDAKTCDYHNGPFSLVALIEDEAVGYLRFLDAANWDRRR